MLCKDIYFICALTDASDMHIFALSASLYINAGLECVFL